MSEWTLPKALEVLSAGDHLRVEHPDYPDEELVVQKYVNGLFVTYRETVLGESVDDPVTEAHGVPVVELGEDEYVGAFQWGTFTIVGFDWCGSLGEEIQEHYAPKDKPKN